MIRRRMLKVSHVTAQVDGHTVIEECRMRWQQHYRQAVCLSIAPASCEHVLTPYGASHHWEECAMPSSHICTKDDCGRHEGSTA